MPVKLFSTLAVKKALDDFVLDAFDAETGIEVEGVFDPTVQLLRRIDAGETFDVMIGVTSSFDELGDIVDLASRRAIARTGVGLAVPSGSPAPDISTTESFVEVLLAARSVAYSRTGASGIYFAKLIEELGIADEINSRATIIEKGFIANAVVDGRADLAVQQLSELLFVPEADIIGPFPDGRAALHRVQCGVEPDGSRKLRRQRLRRVPVELGRSRGLRADPLGSARSPSSYRLDARTKRGCASPRSPSSFVRKPRY